MSRQLYSTNNETKKKRLIATFKMDGKALDVEWADNTEWYQRDIEANGIVFGGDVLKPSDGRTFYDALPKVFSRSSTMYVVDT